jgi:hypothetical protein
MLCVSCGRRKGKRACPALGGLICTTCCGTKRLKEIACPPDCQYLASAQAHPPAAILRQRERDLPLLASLLTGLNERQGDLLALLTSRVRRARAGAIPPLRDEDVREAAQALAATLDTAARGIVYEHQPASVPARRLMRAWQETLAELERHGQSLRPSLVAPVVHRVEELAREVPKALGTGISGNEAAAETLFLDFLERVLRPPAGSDQEGPAIARADAPSGLIVP